MLNGIALELPVCRRGSGVGGGAGGGASHTITISVSYASGSGAPDITSPQGPVTSVAQGTDLSLVIDARGYGLAIAAGGLVVDGVAVPAADAQSFYTYTFTNVAAAHVVAITLEVADMLHPFEFPIAGILRTTDPVVGVDLIGGTRETIFNAPVGTAGVVRNIAWIAAAVVDGTANTCDTDLYVEFFYDGSGTAAFSVPLFTLAGMEHHEFALPDLFYSTPAFELTAGPHVGAAPWTTVFGSSSNWRLPIPFTNGLKIDIVSGSPTVSNKIYVNIMWQDELPACWNRNLRLMATRSNQTLAAGSPGPSVTLLAGNVVSRSLGSWAADIVGKSLIVEGASVNDLLIIERTSSLLLKASSRDMAHAVLNEPFGCNIHTHHQFLSLPGGGCRLRGRHRGRRGLRGRRRHPVRGQRAALPGVRSGTQPRVVER